MLTGPKKQSPTSYCLRRLFVSGSGRKDLKPGRTTFHDLNLSGSGGSPRRFSFIREMRLTQRTLPGGRQILRKVSIRILEPINPRRITARL